MRTARERAIEFCDHERGEGKHAEFTGYVERLTRILNSHAVGVLREIGYAVRAEAEQFGDDEIGETIVTVAGVAIDNVCEKINGGDQ